MDPSHCYENISQCETRDWAVPGEKLFFIIKASPSLLRLDALSFRVVANRKTLRSRRSTLLHTPTLVLEDLYIDAIETKEGYKCPQMSPFRLPDGHAIYPTFVEIPISLTAGVTLEVYIPRFSAPVAKKDLKSLSPFSVSLKKHASTISYILQFNISVCLKGQEIDEVEIESTDIMFDSKPPHNEENYLSNILVNKPCNIKGVMLDNQNLSAVFSLSPITEIGSAMLSDILILFMVKWKIKNLLFTTKWKVNLTNPSSLSMAILLPPVTTKVLSTTTVPLRITNLKEVKNNIELVFEGGAIQPVAQRIPIPELPVGESLTMNLSFLPLSTGYHQLKFWVEDKGVRIDPLFPTYINVIE